MLNITSQMFKRAEYNAETETLSLTFVNNGKTYEYSGFPPAMVEQFMAADSKGTFFARNIRGRYPCKIL